MEKPTAISVDIATENCKNDNLVCVRPAVGFIVGIQGQTGDYEQRHTKGCANYHVAGNMVSYSSFEMLAPWICLISRLSTLYIGREMGRLGFGSGSFFFLSELYREEGLSQDELSRRVGVDKSNTARALARLERDGLVRREADSLNHRVKRVYLEPAARRLKAELRTIQAEWHRILLQGVPDDEAERVLLYLKRMTGNAAACIRDRGILAQNDNT